MSHANPKDWMHELKVHQAELEIQNEELRRVQLELATARDRYLDLYDFSPVGYLTLNRRGLIIEANLTASTLFEVARKTLLGQNFTHLLSSDSAQVWELDLQRVFQGGDAKRLELCLRRHDGTLFDGQLDCLPMAHVDLGMILRIALTDISDRKRAEAHQRMVNEVIEASEAVRRKVSRELHEELGQQLSVLKMALSNLNQAAHDPPRHDKRLAEIQSGLADAIAMIRRMAADMRPMMLDDLGLNATIEWLASESARRLNLEVPVTLDPHDPPVDERTSIALYRMVCDMINQLACIGHTNRIDVGLHCKGATLELTVKSSSNWPSPPDGLIERSDMTQSLRKRVLMLQGQFLLERTPTGGVLLAVKLPVAVPPSPTPTIHTPGTP